MSDQQARDRVRRTLDAAARESIPDNLDLRLDVLRVLAQRHGPGPDRLVRVNGEDDELPVDDDETLNQLRAWLRDRSEAAPQPERWPAPHRQSWRREALKLAAAALVFALVGALLVVTLRGGGEQKGTQQPAPTPTPIPVRPVSASFDVTGRPYGLALTPDSVWAPDIDSGGVRRIDPATGTIDAEVDLGATGWQDPAGAGCGCSPMFAATSPDGVWVSRSSGTSEAPVFEVVRIDAESSDIELVVPLEVLPDKLAIAAGDLWVTSTYHDALIRIDAATGAQLATIAIDNPRGMIAATKRGVWVTSLSNNAVSRIDPATNTVVATVTIGSPLALAVAGDAVWVASLNEGALFSIDPATNEVVARVDIVGPDWLTAGDGSLWVHSATTGEVLRLDPASGETLARYRTGSGVATMAAGENVLWIALANEQQLQRIDLD